ncbi:MAG: hypothetical protein ACFCVD_25160 [Nodosilinea sp.]
MTLLARLLQFLRFLEGALEFLDFLATPLGTIASVGIVLYGGLVVAGLEASAAATLAGSVALALSCIITRPRF